MRSKARSKMTSNKKCNKIANNISIFHADFICSRYAVHTVMYVTLFNLITDHVRRENLSMLAARGIVGSTHVAAFEIIVTLE